MRTMPDVESPMYQRLLRVLIALREEKEITGRQLGKRLKKSHSFVNKVESGERRLDVAEFVAYCRALRIDPLKVLKKVIGKR